VRYTLRRERNAEQERREQRRYAFLERLYLLTGEDCEYAVSPDEIQAELEVSTTAHVPEVEDLVRLGHVRYAETEGQICITETGIEYLRQTAWRRRSVRD
jgi:predicted transcriptional regulator